MFIKKDILNSSKLIISNYNTHIQKFLNENHILNILMLNNFRMHKFYKKYNHYFLFNISLAY